MAFADKLATRKPRTAAEAYNEWFNNLPNEEGNAVWAALQDPAWPHVELKPVLEADEDHPAPKFGATAFREWRRSLTKGTA